MRDERAQTRLIALRERGVQGNAHQQPFGLTQATGRRAVLNKIQQHPDIARILCRQPQQACRLFRP
ncbi:hypothetical protein D3C71_1838710 [compost metagenome]